MRMAALIPARAGSKRVPGKNIRPLAGHPLIVYTLAAAFESDVFCDVVVCSDDPAINEIGAAAGALRYLRGRSGDNEPDIQWVDHVLADKMLAHGLNWDAIAILRPTSPFRSADMIRRAVGRFADHGDGYHSLRAVEPCSQHPGKMWTWAGVDGIVPLLLQPTGTPWHSQPTQNLPAVWVQNASLEISWTATVETTATIAGTRVLGFLTQCWEGFDINTERDWHLAEWAIETGQATLPEVK